MPMRVEAVHRVQALDATHRGPGLLCAAVLCAIALGGPALADAEHERYVERSDGPNCLADVTARRRGELAGL